MRVPFLAFWGDSVLSVRLVHNRCLLFANRDIGHSLQSPSYVMRPPMRLGGASASQDYEDHSGERHGDGQPGAHASGWYGGFGTSIGLPTAAREESGSLGNQKQHGLE